MKKVAIIVNYSWVGVSSPLINSVYFLLEQGCAIDIYIDRPDFKRFPMPIYFFDNKQISIYKIKGLGRGLLGDLYFLLLNVWRWKKYEIIIAYDFQAVLRGAIVKWYTGGILIYHNLEFLVSTDFKTWYYKIRERFASRYAKFILTQDRIRAEWLSNDLKQPISKFRIVFNSSRGDDMRQPLTNYFRTKFKIPSSARIILAIGSLINEHLILEIVKAAIHWDESKVLVLHGWFADPKLQSDVMFIQRQYPGRLFISEELFNDGNKFIPFASCDIGFVGYSNSSLNHKFAGGASGKFFDFIKAGKPILAFDTPGIKQIIEENQIGRLISNCDSIEKSLNEIINNYDFYAKNCISNFGKFEFDRNFHIFLKEVF